LFSSLLDLAGFKGDETVIDAYSGTGVIGLITARRVKKVIGIELNPQAVADARENAAINDILNAEFICGDVPAVAPTLAGKPDVIIADPPRKGLEPEFVSYVLESEVPRVIYVSCDPATLARDLKLLAAKYEIKAVQPVDMFPQTAHVETICVMERKG
jgi:23S rRNA (uracil1939-C5)-methyltransferase